MVKHFHVAIAKHLIIDAIRRDGAKTALTNWEGTDDEAVDTINKDGRSSFTFAKCDNQDKEGLCKGHKKVN